MPSSRTFQFLAAGQATLNPFRGACKPTVPQYNHSIIYLRHTSNDAGNELGYILDPNGYRFSSKQFSKHDPPTERSSAESPMGAPKNVRGFYSKSRICISPGDSAG